VSLNQAYICAFRADCFYRLDPIATSGLFVWRSVTLARGIRNCLTRSLLLVRFSCYFIQKSTAHIWLTAGNEADPVTPFVSAKSIADALGDISAVLIEQDDYGVRFVCLWSFLLTDGRISEL
jgi:hypothetical protein